MSFCTLRKWLLKEGYSRGKLAQRDLDEGVLSRVVLFLELDFVRWICECVPAPVHKHQ